jgi:hypothetical protein
MAFASLPLSSPTFHLALGALQYFGVLLSTKQLESTVAKHKSMHVSQSNLEVFHHCIFSELSVVFPTPAVPTIPIL